MLLYKHSTHFFGREIFVDATRAMSVATGEKDNKQVYSIVGKTRRRCPSPGPCLTLSALFFRLTVLFFANVHASTFFLHLVVKIDKYDG